MIQQLIYLLCIISQTKSTWLTREKIYTVFTVLNYLPSSMYFFMHFNPNKFTVDTSEHRIMILLVNKIIYLWLIV